MFIIIKFSILVLICLSATSAEICPKVRFYDGKMTSVDDISSCTFTIGEDPSRTFRGYEVTAYSIYGIVRMDCGLCQATISSLYSECKDCTFCLHNEYIKGCRAVVIPILVALLLALVLIMLTGCVCRCLGLPTKLATAWKAGRDKTHYRRAARREKSARKLLSTGLLLPSFPPRQLASCPDYIELEERQGLSTTIDASATCSLYPLADLESVRKASPTIERKTREEASQASTATITRPTSPSPVLSRRPAIPTFNRNAAAALLIPALMVGKAASCDVTAYVSNANLIYRDSGMTELYTGIFMMMSRQTICLRYLDNTVDRISLTDTWLEELYSPLYRTSDFTVESETKWNCMGSGQCWSGYCQIDSQHPDWAGELSNGKTKATTRYGCFQAAAYCSHCTYNKQCVYYKVSVNQKGELYTVYHLTETDWKANVVIVRSDGSITKHRLSSKLITAGDNVVIGLSGPSYVEYRYNDFLIQNGVGLTWSVNANNLGDLSSGLIGDYQIGLYNDSQTAFMMTTIVCQPNSCNVRCMAPQSGLVRGLNQYRNYSVDAMKYGDDLILTKTTSMSFNAYITTNKVFGINVIEATCSFQLQATYGCTACNKPSVAYIQAKDIRSSGLIKFTSNCSLDTNVLSCQEDPQELKITGHQQNCAIYIRNQTLILSVDYIFEGQIYSMGAVITSGNDASVGQLTMAFISNPNFLTSLTSLMTIAGMIGAVLTIIKAIARYSALYAGARAGQDLTEKS